MLLRYRGGNGFVWDCACEISGIGNGNGLLWACAGALFCAGALCCGGSGKGAIWAGKGGKVCLGCASSFLFSGDVGGSAGAGVVGAGVVGAEGVMDLISENELS